MFSIAAQKALVLGGLALLLVVLTAQLANLQLLPTTILVAGCGAFVVSRATRLSPEIWIFGFLVAGYFWGNRAFAQLNVRGVFIGELGLAILLGIALLYVPYRRTLPFRREPLGVVIFIALAYTFTRLLNDLPEHGILAIRDAAMVYYALFFFLAQAMARDAATLGALKGWLAFVYGGTILLIAVFFGGSPLPHLTFNGVPLIYIKTDLGATFLAGICVWSVVHAWATGKRAWLIMGFVAALLCASLVSRAAFVGLGFAFLLLSLAGLRGMVRGLFVGGTALLVILTVEMVVNHGQYEQSRLHGMVEHVRGIVDFDGTANYSSQAARDTGDNNRFRLTWWQFIWEETTTRSPWFGLGLGTDISAGFAQTHWWGGSGELSARSPHSYPVTVFARLGWIGVAILLAGVVLMARYTWQVLRWCRREGRPHPALAWWLFVWAVSVSACFGVVLEGPMASIPFWMMLGIARELMSQQPEGTATAGKL